MANCSDIQQTEAWTESKKEMISILNKKIEKITVDQHFKNVGVNDFHMGIYSFVSWLSLLTFQKKTQFSRQIKLVLLSIARMTERKYAMKLPSICVACSFSSSSHWDWLYASYLQRKMNMKKLL